LVTVVISQPGKELAAEVLLLVSAVRVVVGIIDW
jgi:hypothetical protein